MVWLRLREAFGLKERILASVWASYVLWISGCVSQIKGVRTDSLREILESMNVQPPLTSRCASKNASSSDSMPDSAFVVFVKANQ